MAPINGFGNRLRSLRRDAGISQEELALRCGRSVEAISNIERGLNYPSFEMLLAVAAALNVSPKAMFEEQLEVDRTELEARIARSIAALDYEDLVVAVRQVEALSSRAKPKHRKRKTDAG